MLGIPDPVENQMVEISSNESAKIVSIAQDLIYAESNGKKQTHKALALRMAVRQITGSVRLLRMLPWFGAYSVNRHCLQT